MRIDVVQLPRDLQQEQLRDRSVVVFDVLRATTTMIAALSAGAKEIRIFNSLDEARIAARAFLDAKVLCGEARCVRPADFDLGNSPRDFSAARVANKTLFLSTTNGTRAIVAAKDAEEIVISALINTNATARYISELHRDVTLLCAGTDGEASIEDSIGAGAVISQIVGAELNESARRSVDQFVAARSSLTATMRAGAGGRNIIAAGLGSDIDFASELDAVDLVARVERDPLRIVRAL